MRGHIQKTIGATILSVGILFAGTAHAQEKKCIYSRFGGCDEAKACEKEYEESEAGGWGGNVHQKPTLVSDAIKAGKLSPECKAEVDRKTKLLAADNVYGKGAKEGRWGLKDEALLQVQAFFDIGGILLNFKGEKKKAEEAKAKEEEAKKKAAEQAAKTELPKGAKKNPALEKQISAAYTAEYPTNKILKVIMRDNDWRIERSSLGIITGRTIDATIAYKKADGTCELHHEGWWQGHDGKKFSKSIEQRGAGSMQLEPILCEKIK